MLHHASSCAAVDAVVQVPSEGTNGFTSRFVFLTALEKWTGPMAGCTAVAALVSEGVLTVANAGDSRCVACRAGRAIAMTVDHKPNDEAEHDRILKVGF